MKNTTQNSKILLISTISATLTACHAIGQNVRKKLPYESIKEVVDATPHNNLQVFDGNWVPKSYALDRKVKMFRGYEKLSTDLFEVVTSINNLMPPTNRFHTREFIELGANCLIFGIVPWSMYQGALNDETLRCNLPNMANMNATQRVLTVLYYKTPVLIGILSARFTGRALLKIINFWEEYFKPDYTTLSKGKNTIDEAWPTILKTKNIREMEAIASSTSKTLQQMFNAMVEIVKDVVTHKEKGLLIEGYQEELASASGQLTQILNEISKLRNLPIDQTQPKLSKLSEIKIECLEKGQRAIQHVLNMLQTT